MVLVWHWMYIDVGSAMPPMVAFQIYDDLSDAWSQEDDEISNEYLHLRLALRVFILFYFCLYLTIIVLFFINLPWYWLGSWLISFSFLFKIKDRGDTLSQMSQDSSDSRDREPIFIQASDIRRRLTDSLNAPTKSFQRDPEDPSAAALKVCFLLSYQFLHHMLYTCKFNII